MKLRKLKGAARALAARVKAWESLDQGERNKGAFKKPGRMKP